MTVRELFGGAIRLIGFWEALHSVNDAYYVFVKLVHLPTSSPLPITTILTSGAFSLMVGTAIVVWADSIVRLIYGAAPAAIPN